MSGAAAMLGEVGALVGAMQAEADRLDAAGGFPEAGLAALRAAGVLGAAVPRALGGLGVGTSPEGAEACAALLMRLGEGSVALGRVVEGHVNALRLVLRDAPGEAAAGWCAEARGGALFALWVTDPAAGGLRVREAAGGLELSGGKAFGSAAGHAGRALVTAGDAAGRARMLVVGMEGAVVSALPAALVGVRGACTGRVSFEGVRVGVGALVGGPGDYLREPDFSGGAWRACAVAAGAAAALVEAMRVGLAARGRLDDPHQRARFGRALVAAGTARLWVAAMAREAEGLGGAAGDGGAAAGGAGSAGWVAARVNLGRTAVEAACVEVIGLVQRSLGLGAFVQGARVERMARDLATYLRQPAPDEALGEAAGFFALGG